MLSLAAGRLAVTKLKMPINEENRLLALKLTKLLDSPPESSFDMLTGLAKQIFGTPVALITLIDESRQWFKSNLGLPINQTSRDVSFCHHTIQSDSVFIVNDALVHPDFKSNPLVTGEPNIRFYAGVPLIDKRGYALGALCVIAHEPRVQISEYHIKSLFDIASLVIEQINMRLTYGLLDPVTELPNRLKLQHDIQNTFQQKSLARCDLIIADLARHEQFTSLLQSLGHNNSDRILRSATEKLTKTEKKNVTVYNLAVYRFALLVVDHSEAEVNALLEQVQSYLQQPFMCGPLPVTFDGVIGVATYPSDITEPDEFIRAASSALLDAKKHHSPMAKYDVNRDKLQQRSFQVLCDLPKALQNTEQLFMVYQPKIDLRDNRCVGVEALIRWRHPDLGMIPPDEFIVLAENTALMTQITDWVINSVFEQMAKWDNELNVAINISIEDLEAPCFVSKLKSYMSGYNIAAQKITLEITETAFMQNPKEAIKAINAIKTLGIAVSIDDFGTGQSNFSYLKHINADSLKIDKIFIQKIPQDSKDTLLTSAILNIAETMNFGAIAEGVETKAAFDWLVEHNCHFAQGDYLSKPLTPEQLNAWLKKCEFAAI